MHAQKTPAAAAAAARGVGGAAVAVARRGVKSEAVDSRQRQLGIWELLERVFCANFPIDGYGDMEAVGDALRRLWGLGYFQIQYSK